MKLIYPAVFKPFSDQSGGYVVEFPDLPGCVTEGKNLEQAIEMGIDAACGWILGELEDGEKIRMTDQLIGKCGFYCGACSTYLAGNCEGCVDEHQEGDCFTRDRVIKRKLKFCGECREFPCLTILTRPHATVLDKDWLQWKKQSDTNR